MNIYKSLSNVRKDESKKGEYTATEVAKKLGICRHLVTDLIRKKTLKPSFKYGSIMYFNDKSISEIPEEMLIKYKDLITKRDLGRYLSLSHQTLVKFLDAENIKPYVVKKTHYFSKSYFEKFNSNEKLCLMCKGKIDRPVFDYCSNACASKHRNILKYTQ